jgi:hypothetical protein
MKIEAIRRNTFLKKARANVCRREENNMITIHRPGCSHR